MSEHSETHLSISHFDLWYYTFFIFNTQKLSDLISAKQLSIKQSGLTNQLLNLLVDMHSFMKKLITPFLMILLFSLQGCSLIDKPKGEWDAKDYYEHAASAMENQNWGLAIRLYEELKAYYPYGKYAEQAYLDLAYVYYRYDEPESTTREIEDFLRLYPKHKEIPYALYLRALAVDSINTSWTDKWITDPASRDMKSTQEAYNAYLILLNEFPNSRFAPEARKRLMVLNNRLARNELKVAQYYYKRQAYLAAANRAKAVLERFPKATVNIDSLALLKQSYEKLGMVENAKNADKVYQLNSGAETATP